LVPAVSKAPADGIRTEFFRRLADDEAVENVPTRAASRMLLRRLAFVPAIL